MTDYGKCPNPTDKDRFYEFKNFNGVYRNRYRKDLKPMTICIAAICESKTSPKIVFVADRLISAGIQFEHGISKIDKVCEFCFVMTSSNDSLKSSMITDRVKTRITNDLTIENIAKLFSDECQKLKLSTIERDVLSNFGLTYEDFISRSKELSDDLTRVIVGELTNYYYTFKTDFIILGFDPIKFIPHIFVVTQDGEYKSHNFLGFATIGSGSDLAFPEITKYVYNPDVSLSEAMVRVYNAKRVAQRVSGVGEATDFLVMYLAEKDDTKEKSLAIWEPSEEIRNLLDDGIKEMKEKDFETYGKIMKNIYNFFMKSQQSDEKDAKQN